MGISFVDEKARTFFSLSGWMCECGESLTKVPDPVDLVDVDTEE